MNKKMKYFKNVELAEMYKVSEKSIRNWIEAAKEERLNLEIVNEGERIYLANTPSNHLILKNLAEKGKKFQNKKALKVIYPKKEFYETYTEKHIIDIISNLEINRELPHKYAYFNGGAKFFDGYINRVLKDDSPITIKYTLKALDFDTDYILSLIGSYEFVNVVDIGPGNGAPVKKFLEFLLKQNKLRKYIAVDISPDMLNTAERNLKEWLGKEFPFEGHIRDINIDSIQELLFKNTHVSDVEELSCINLIFYLGSTIENQRKYDESLHTIKNSMGRSDVLLLGQALDTDKSKIHLSFNSRDKNKKNSDLDLVTVVIDLLNINEEYYEINRHYDEKLRSRIISVKLKVNLQIKFETSSFKQSVFLLAKEEVIIFRHNHHTSIEVFNTLNDIGFDTIHSTCLGNGENMLVICKTKSA